MPVNVHYEKITEHIGQITLDRPMAANAMSSRLLTELAECVVKVNNDHSIYSVILTAKGEKAFCAGADLKERKPMNDEETIAMVRFIGKVINDVAAIQVPVIAAINGVAFGGGLELALACDIRIAAHHVKMGLPETSLAIIPGAGGTQRLPRLIGVGKAKQLIYTAQPVQAMEALELGLVEKVCPSDCLLEDAIKMAQTIAKNGPVALKQAKLAIDQGLQTDITTGLHIEHLCYKATIPTNDRQEGLIAFSEKRQAIYTGK